jgi:hypothetical protein
MLSESEKELLTQQMRDTSHAVPLALFTGVAVLALVSTIETSHGVFRLWVREFFDYPMELGSPWILGLAIVGATIEGISVLRSLNASKRLDQDFYEDLLTRPRLCPICGPGEKRQVRQVRQAPIIGHAPIALCQKLECGHQCHIQTLAIAADPKKHQECNCPDYQRPSN